MSQTARFTISSPSRHSANQRGYDSDEHRYKPEYVNPTSWELSLRAFPEGWSEDDNGRVLVPADIASLRWIVDQVDGPFFEARNHKRSRGMLQAQFNLPGPGNYEVTLRLNLTSGESVSNTRRYRLRDFLVVSIGDSFSSGQGNPDVPAVPAEDDRAMCEATTLYLMASRFQETVGNFLKAAEESSEDTIEEYLPFIGAIAVSVDNSFQDIRSYIKGKIKGLRDSIVGFVESALVEGAEELAGWIGFGDGGESVEAPHPAEWQEPNAYRSYRSAPSLAARQIETDASFGSDKATFLSFARTGSEIQDGLLGPRTVDVPQFGWRSIDAWIDDKGQVAEVEDTLAGRRIDALIISVGVNDLEFSSLVTSSVLWPGTPGFPDRRELLEAAWQKIDGQLARDFARLAAVIDERLAPENVFLLEYPVGAFSDIETLMNRPCDVLGSKSGLDLNFGEAAELGALGARLNQVLHAVADNLGWTMIDGIEKEFDGHGYCADRSYYVSAAESCLNQGDFEGMLHPNASGHAIARDRIALALKENMLKAQEKWLEPVMHMMMT